jgi:hypothetical protein
MSDRHAVPPGYPAVGGKLVHVAFGFGQVTSDAGVLRLAEVDRRLGGACDDDMPWAWRCLGRRDTA